MIFSASIKMIVFSFIKLKWLMTNFFPDIKEAVYFWNKQNTHTYKRQFATILLRIFKFMIEGIFGLSYSFLIMFCQVFLSNGNAGLLKSRSKYSVWCGNLCKMIAFSKWEDSLVMSSRPRDLCVESIELQIQCP